MKKRHSVFWTLLFTILSITWVAPLAVVLMNSFKKKAFISRDPFALPAVRTYAGFGNYQNGIELTQFPQAAVTSVVITVLSVGLILLCTSMCAWYISRIPAHWTHAVYLLCLFSMVIPFQMVMFPLSKIANLLRLNTPLTLPLVYLGFGSGMGVFLFTGNLRQSPVAIEESAMIDGCNPLRLFFSVVIPVMQPILISAGILETMWIWNDYLLPYLILDLKRFKTIPIAVQYLRGGYGSVDMGAMMAMLVLAIAPVVILYVFLQKYIVSGVAAGAVKG